MHLRRRLAVSLCTPLNGGGATSSIHHALRFVWRWAFYIRSAESEWQGMADEERAEADREQAAFGVELDRFELTEAKESPHVGG